MVRIYTLNPKQPLAVQTFFTMKTVLEGKPLSAAWTKYQTEIWDSVKACWTVWVPAQLINFAFVPRHFRVPFGANSEPRKWKWRPSFCRD